MVVVIGGDLVGLLTTMMRWGLLTIFPPTFPPEAEVVARLTEMVGLLTVVVIVVVGDDNSAAADAGCPEEVFRPCGGEQWSFS